MLVAIKALNKYEKARLVKKDIKFLPITTINEVAKAGWCTHMFSW